MKTFEGVVISAKMQKTVIVEVMRQVAHPLYKKLLRKNKKYKVDSEDFSVSEGDRVKIVETRPISKDKHFKILKILNNKGQEEIKIQKNDSSKRRKKKWFNIEVF